MVRDERTMNESVVLLRPENETGLVIEIEIVRELPEREADQELRQVGVAVVSRGLQVLSTSIATYLVLRAAEAVAGKARPLEVQPASGTGAAAETGIGIEIEIRTESLDVLGMRRRLVVGVGLAAGVVEGIGRGRRLGVEVAVRM
jgi:hypothetical protein